VTILGIDPGLRITGYGLLDAAGQALDWGCICPPVKAPLEERLYIVASSVEELIERFSPSALSVEMQFVHLNPQSALKLGMVRGALLFLAQKKGLKVAQYSPSSIKKACTGRGKAHKTQMQYFISQRLSICLSQLPEDAADALAAALCYLQDPLISLLPSKPAKQG
jgi:crossover junction endodeoxyribonuclease RuvC